MSTNDSAISSLSGLSILLTDDHDDFALLLRTYLAANGANVEIATDGMQALSKASRVCYDLILVDIQMPEMDGYELTRRLRAAGTREPIIAVTAHAMRHHAEQALAAGCNEVFTKPVSLPALKSAIIRHCRSSKPPGCQAPKPTAPSRQPSY